MKNPEKRHVAAILFFYIGGLIMLAVGNPNANPASFHWQSQILQGLIAGLGGIFVCIGFVYALIRAIFLPEEKQKTGESI